MTVPFRPTVVREDRDFLDTVTRAFSQGRAFIERETESRRRREEFESQEQLAGLRQRSLEAELEAQNLAQRTAITADPRLTIGPPPPGGDLEGAFFDQAPVPGPQPARGGAQPPAALAPDLQATELLAPEIPTLPPEAGEGADLELLGGDQPDVFGVEGEAVQLANIQFQAPAPQRLGVPEPSPPSVSSELAEQLAPERGIQTMAPRRPAVSQVGTIGGEEVFFDPSGQQRQQSEAGSQIRQVLNGLAAREDQAGRTDEGDQIRRQINGIVAIIEAGGDVDPGKLIQGILSTVRQNAQLQQMRDFLANQIGEDKLPEGLNELPLRAQVEELENVRRGITRRPTGQLTEGAIASGVRQMLTDRAIDPNKATPDQVNEARSQFIRFARGVGEEDVQVSKDAGRRAQLSRIIPTLLESLDELDDTEQVQKIRDNMAALQAKVDQLSGPELLDEIHKVVEQQRDVDAARR